MNDFKNLDQFYIYKGKVFLIGDLSSRTPMLETAWGVSSVLSRSACGLDTFP